MVVEVGSKPKLFLTLVGQCLKLAQWEFGSDNFHKIKITLMLELKIRLRIWHYYITQFQLSSDSREMFVKVLIFMKQKMVLFTKVVPTFELS